MTEVGVRELKRRTSEIVRRVREEKESVTITYRGRAVAKLVPIDNVEDTRAEAQAVMAKMDRLASEISAGWPAGVSAVDAVKEQRRDL